MQTYIELSSALLFAGFFFTGVLAIDGLRKNSLFHTSVDGANASAIIYSLVETAKANSLNVFQYIYTLLLYMPGCKDKSAGMEHLLPWSDFIKEHCTGLIDVETVTVENHPQLPV